VHNHVINYSIDLCLYIFPDPVKAKVVFVNLVPDLSLGHLLVVEDVFLEELVVSVLMTTVEKPVSLYLVIPEALLLVV